MLLAAAVSMDRVKSPFRAFLWSSVLVPFTGIIGNTTVIVGDASFAQPSGCPSVVGNKEGTASFDFLGFSPEPTWSGDMPASKSCCGSFSAQNLFQNKSSFLQCPQLKVCPTLAHGHVREDMTQCLLEAVPINQHNTQKKLKIKC